MSVITLASHEADDPKNEGNGYYLVVTMRSGRVYRGALRKSYGTNASNTFVLEMSEQGVSGVEERTLYLNELDVECVEIEW